MQLIKEKILFKSRQTQNIKFFLTADNSFGGLQENINDFVEEETGLSINNSEDAETYRYSPIGNISLNASFYSGGTYDDTYVQAGFTTGETSTRNEVVLRSFFLLQVYDSTSPENQTLLHSGYFNGFDFLPLNTGNTTYSYNNDEEFADLYLPNFYIDTLTATTTMYGKLSFYNAKTGKLDLFSIYSASTSNPPLPETDGDLYFEISLSADTFAYDVDTIYAYEIANDDYVDKINNTLTSFTNQKPTYPTGNTFLNTGRYIEN